MLGQLELSEGKADAARDAFQRGLRRCPASVPLWRAAAGLEEGAGALGRARAILEQARLKVPHDEDLWLAAIRTEGRGGQEKAAEAMLAKALQECPASGRLWAEAVQMAPRPQRKSKSVDALRCALPGRAAAAWGWAARRAPRRRQASCAVQAVRQRPLRHRGHRQPVCAGVETRDPAEFHSALPRTRSFCAFISPSEPRVSAPPRPPPPPSPLRTGKWTRRGPGSTAR